MVYIGLKIRICFHEFSFVILPKIQFEAAMNPNKSYVMGGTTE